MHRWYHHFVDCLPFISVLLSLFSSAVYISSSILCSSPLYSRELCTCFAVCLVYLNSLSNRVLQLFSPPSSEFDSPLAFSPPIPLHCIGPPQLPPLHAHTTLSHSTTQPFATLLLSTPARLVSRIQIKSINQSINQGGSPTRQHLGANHVSHIHQHALLGTRSWKPMLTIRHCTLFSVTTSPLLLPCFRTPSIVCQTGARNGV